MPSMSTFLCKNGVRKEYFLTPTFIIEPFFCEGGKDQTVKECNAGSKPLLQGGWVQNDSPLHVFFDFPLALQSSLRNPGERSSLPFVEKRHAVSHPPLKPGNGMKRFMETSKFRFPRFAKADRCVASSSKGKDQMRTISGAVMIFI